jgi:hypothetical protein
MGEPYEEAAGVPVNLLLTLPYQGGSGGSFSEGDWRFTSAENVDTAQPQIPGNPSGWVLGCEGRKAALITTRSIIGTRGGLFRPRIP